MINTNLSDEELIAAFKRTSEANYFGLIFQRYRTLVYGVCLKYLKDRDDAKDAVMQIFEKLQNSLKTQEINLFRSWLYVTSRNHCLMQLRAGKGRIKVEISSSFMENELLLHLTEEPPLEENLSKLEKCIEALTDGQQRCVKLFFLQEKCYQEIAQSTGLELNQVKSHIQNGKRNLKICLERNG